MIGEEIPRKIVSTNAFSMVNLCADSIRHHGVPGVI